MGIRTLEALLWSIGTLGLFVQPAEAQSKREALRGRLKTLVSKESNQDQRAQDLVERMQGTDIDRKSSFQSSDNQVSYSLTDIDVSGGGDNSKDWIMIHVPKSVSPEDIKFYFEGDKDSSTYENVTMSPDYARQQGAKQMLSLSDFLDSAKKSHDQRSTVLNFAGKIFPKAKAITYSMEKLSELNLSEEQAKVFARQVGKGEGTYYVLQPGQNFNADLLNISIPGERSSIIYPSTNGNLTAIHYDNGNVEHKKLEKTSLKDIVTKFVSNSFKKKEFDVDLTRSILRDIKYIPRIGDVVNIGDIVEENMTNFTATDSMLKFHARDKGISFSQAKRSYLNSKNAEVGRLNLEKGLSQTKIDKPGKLRYFSATDIRNAWNDMISEWEMDVISSELGNGQHFLDMFEKLNRQVGRIDEGSSYDDYRKVFGLLVFNRKVWSIFPGLDISNYKLSNSAIPKNSGFYKDGDKIAITLGNKPGYEYFWENGVLYESNISERISNQKRNDLEDRLSQSHIDKPGFHRTYSASNIRRAWNDMMLEWKMAKLSINKGNGKTYFDWYKERANEVGFLSEDSSDDAYIRVFNLIVNNRRVWSIFPRLNIDNYNLSYSTVPRYSTFYRDGDNIAITLGEKPGYDYYWDNGKFYEYNIAESNAQQRQETYNQGSTMVERLFMGVMQTIVDTKLQNINRRRSRQTPSYTQSNDRSSIQRSTSGSNSGSWDLIGYQRGSLKNPSGDLYYQNSVTGNYAIRNNVTGKMIYLSPGDGRLLQIKKQYK